MIIGFILIILLIIVLMEGNEQNETMLNLSNLSNQSNQSNQSQTKCLVELKYNVDRGKFKYEYTPGSHLNLTQHFPSAPENPFIVFNIQSNHQYPSESNHQLPSESNHQLPSESNHQYPSELEIETCADTGILGSCRRINKECVDFVSRQFCDRYQMTWDEKPCIEPIVQFNDNKGIHVNKTNQTFTMFNKKSNLT
jgi:hypothetical protein